MLKKEILFEVRNKKFKYLSKTKLRREYVSTIQGSSHSNNL